MDKNLIGNVKEISFGSTPSKTITSLYYKGPVSGTMEFEFIDFRPIKPSFKCSCGTDLQDFLIEIGKQIPLHSIRSGILCMNPECNKTFTISRD